MNVKKKYISPKLEAVGVDRDILLVSMSSDRGDMPGAERGESGDVRPRSMPENRIFSEKPFNETLFSE